MHWLVRILQKNLPLRYQGVLLFLLVFFPSAILAAQYHPDTGFSAAITFGENFHARLIPPLQAIPLVTHLGGGYDGQFYAQLAFDPLLQDPATAAALDIPLYRARRIFIPAWVNLLSFGRPDWTLQNYALINLPFYLALLYGIYHYLKPRSLKDFLLLAATVSTTGAMLSISRTLLDLPAAVLLFYACILPPGSALVCISAAILTKETSLLCLPVPFKIHQRSPFKIWLGWAAQAALTLLPFAAWNLYLFMRFSSQGFFGSGNFSLPLLGYSAHVSEMWQVLLGGDVILGVTELAAIGSLTVQAVYLSTHPRIASPYWKMGIGYALLFFCLGGSVLGRQLAYDRAVLPLTFAFNLLLWQQDEKAFLRWFLPGNLGVQTMLLAAIASALKI